MRSPATSRDRRGPTSSGGGPTAGVSPGGSPDAFQEPPTLNRVRANLERAGQAWQEGSLLPLSIAVPADGGWRLVGWVQLMIDRPARSGEVGYWLDAGHVGRGLVTRAVTAVLDHAFGPLGLERVGLPTTVDNTRSRSVAERLGFTREAVLREAAAFPDERRDLVVYGLLAGEWHPPPGHPGGAGQPIRNQEATGMPSA